MPQRTIDSVDATYGLQQLELIAWTTISTAKQNPVAGLAVLASLRDLVARWTVTEHDGTSRDHDSPVVYHDNLLHAVVDAFESIAVAAYESYEHRMYAGVLSVLAELLPRAGTGQLDALDGVVRRTAGTLDRHVRTRRLREAAEELVTSLRAVHLPETADVVTAAIQRDSLSS